MSEKKENKKLNATLIAAIVAIIMGFILAVGYPTGGVKAKDVYSPRTSKMVRQQRTKKDTTINKLKVKKKVVKPLPPPTSQEDTEDEGC